MNKLLYTQKPFIADREIGVYNLFLGGMYNIFWGCKNFDHTRAVKWLYRNSPDKDDFWKAFVDYEMHDFCTGLDFLRGRARKELKNEESSYYLYYKDVIESGLLTLEDFRKAAQKAYDQLLKAYYGDADAIRDEYPDIADLALLPMDELRLRVEEPMTEE